MRNSTAGQKKAAGPLTAAALALTLLLGWAGAPHAPLGGRKVEAEPAGGAPRTALVIGNGEEA